MADEIKKPEVTLDDAEAIAIEDAPEAGKGDDDKVGDLLGFVTKKYRRAVTNRYYDEQRLLKAYRNFRGVYGPDVEWRESEKSRIFVKVSKTKALAAYGQIVDVLFGNDKFPIGIQPTTLPEGVADAMHFEMQEMPEQPEGEMPELQPGGTQQTLTDRLGALAKKLNPVLSRVKEGPGTTQTAITVHPSQVAAAKMQKKIHDQLEESHGNMRLRRSALDQCVYGTGILKGPFAIDKEYPRWKEGVYSPVTKTIPQISYVSIWDFYPDPDADNMEEAEHACERHKMSRSKLRALKKRPYFRANAIDAAIETGENYIEAWWETQVEEEENNAFIDRFEVIEFWGYVDTTVLVEHGVELPKGLEDADEVSCNVWICNGQVLRAVLNPYKPSYIPYHAAPYEINPESFFGIGVCENMDDTQSMMNGFMRMAIDNAALSGNLIIEVDETNLVPGQDFTVYPGKVFRRDGGAPGQAIFGTKYPNVSNENMQMFDKARQLADESTGLPSFAHGQTGVTGVGRTSSGISMLMSAANGSIRTVVKNIDDYQLSPLGKALFHFNMQFDNDPEIQGDLEVKARGTESLMANEVRSQRLMQFLGVVQAPPLAPFAKMDYIIREIAKSMDLDPDKVTNNLADAAIQAEIMKKFQDTMQPPEGAPPGGPPAPSDTSGGGGGNIGVGSAPQPGEQGFSAAPQEPQI